MPCRILWKPRFVQRKPRDGADRCRCEHEAIGKVGILVAKKIGEICGNHHAREIVVCQGRVTVMREDEYFVIARAFVDMFGQRDTAGLDCGTNHGAIAPCG